MSHSITHFLHDLWHHLWNTLLGLNSLLFGAACFYVIYSAGASIYYLTIRPLEMGIVICLILFFTELLFGALEEIAG